MSCLLITGGAGFIGTNFVLRLQEHSTGQRLLIVDALHYAGRRENLQPLIERGAVDFVQGDIRDEALLRSLLREYQVSAVVNFAAHTHVDRSIADPRPFYQNNVEGTCSLLSAVLAVQSECGRSIRFHQISTDEVFGSLGPDDPPFAEDFPYRPNSPYSASKAAADHFVRAFFKTYGLAATISYCSNNYGPYQYPEKLLPLSLAALLQGRRIPVYGDGRQRREWIYVDDHCRGVELVLSRGRPGRCYNIGGGVSLSNLEFLQLLYQTLGAVFAARQELASIYPQSFAAPAACGGEVPPFAAVVEHVADRPGHDRRYALDPRRAAAELGFTASTPLASGMRQAVLWYIDRKSYWQNASVQSVP